MLNSKKLDSFHDYCRSHGISYALHYVEPTNSWYITTSSPSPQERIITKDISSVDACVETAVRLLGEVKQW